MIDPLMVLVCVGGVLIVILMALILYMLVGAAYYDITKLWRKRFKPSP